MGVHTCCRMTSVNLPVHGRGMIPPVGNSTKHRDPTPSNSIAKDVNLGLEYKEVDN